MNETCNRKKAILSKRRREKNYSLVQRAVAWSIKFGKKDWSISKQIWT